MDADIYALVGKYGFKNVHDRLVEIMRQEYDFLRTHFETVLNKVEVTPAPIKQATPVLKKPRKQKGKKEPETVDTVLLSSPDTVEIKDVIVHVPEKPGFRSKASEDCPEGKSFRDPKEVKEFQKTAEDAKRKENEAAGIQIFQILTKENLKKWVEEEGRTYAWVAREKAGCADTQVAATAQMMGIKSKISKKRGMIMIGK